MLMYELWIIDTNGDWEYCEVVIVYNIPLIKY